MIKESRKARIRKKFAEVKKSKTRIKTAQDGLLYELRLAQDEGASYAELGDLLGVSRQRVHQMMNAEEKEVLV